MEEREKRKREEFRVSTNPANVGFIEENFLLEEGISVFFERFSTFPLFLFGEGPFSWLSSKVVLVTLPDVRSSNALHTCDTRLWNQVIYSE